MSSRCNQILLVALLLASNSLHAQIDKCPCGTITDGKSKHMRVAKKDRPIPAHPGTPTALTIGKMINDWDLPASFKKDDSSTFVHESTIFTVKGYLRLIRIEENDCDIHMEIGESESGDHDRIIAEIPNTPEYCSVQADMLDQLKTKYGVDHVGTEPVVFGDDTENVPTITVTGYAFLDTAHKSKKNGKKGHGHGSADVMTLWEIHPVFQFKLEN